MRRIIKLLVVVLVTVLLISSIYLVFFREIEEPAKTENGNNIPDDNQNDNDNNDGNETEGNNETDTDKNQTRFVFIEEATFTTCKFCVDVADILNDLYKSENFPIYYVSMVKENEKAEERLEKDYNIYAYPTVFIDGGYRVVYGKKDKSVFTSRISDALKRERPNLYINVTAEWDKNNSKIIVSGIVENMENNTYDGFLKVYLTEIVSTNWQDYSGSAYKFAFLEFLIEENIKLDVNESYNFTKTFADTGFDPENLKIFAVVFNSESVEKFSNPIDDGGDGNNTFNAYYVDAVYSTEVVEGGNTPPDVGINIPQQGKIHLFGTPIFNIQFRNTFLIGKTTIKANAEDDGGISKVEFYIDGELKSTDKSAPYEYSFRKIDFFKKLIRKHTITVKAYDNTDKTSQSSIEVITIYL